MMDETPRQERQSQKDGPLSRVYHEQIEPLLEQITVLCDEHGIDYLAAFVLDDHGESYQVAGRTHIERDGLMHMHLAADLIKGEAHTMLMGLLDAGVPKGRA